MRDKKTKRHLMTISPVTAFHAESRFRVTCSCGYCSDTLPSINEAYLDAAIHRRSARRNNPKTADPRWLGSRRPAPGSA